MKNKKIWLIALIVIICIVLNALTIFFITSLPWTLIYFGGMISKNPPVPEVSYGEFPFKLVYEQNGELIEIEDVLIIEHKGVEWNEGRGKYNNWNRCLKSQGTKGYIRTNVILYDGFLKNGNSATIYFELGSCEYYMGLEEDKDFYWYSDITPGDIVMLSSEYNGPLTPGELYYQTGIKIISKELSPPIITSEGSSS